MTTAPALDRCGFCGRGEHQVRLMVKGCTAAICDDCTRDAAAIVVLGKGNVFSRADLRQARADGRDTAMAEVARTMEAVERRRQGPGGVFGAILERLKDGKGCGDG